MKLNWTHDLGAWSLLGIVVIVFLSCTSDQESAINKQVADWAAITRVQRLEESAINRGNIGDLVSVFSDSAVLEVSGRAPIEGNQAIREYLRETLVGVRVNFRHETLSLDIVEHRAIERWTATWTERRDNRSIPVTYQMKGTHTYERDRDGRWKIIRDEWGPMLPDRRKFIHPVQ